MGTKKEKLSTDRGGALKKSSAGRVKIRSNVVAVDFSAKRRLDGDYPFSRDSLPVQPHGNMRLTNTTTGDLCQPGGETRLPTGLLDNCSESGNRHASDNNTDGVIDVNTRCVIRLMHTGGMPKRGNTTPFWERLTYARETCVPPKSMLQKDIAKEYGAAFQSTVTKWKTGGPDGKTSPDPNTVLKMAMDTGVDVNWLWSGRGVARQKILDPVTQQIVVALEQLEEHEKIAYLKELSAVPAMRRISAAKHQSDKNKNFRREARS